MNAVNRTEKNALAQALGRGSKSYSGLILPPLNIRSKGKSQAAVDAVQEKDDATTANKEVDPLEPVHENPEEATEVPVNADECRGNEGEIQVEPGHSPRPSSLVAMDV